ncbi:MAG: hypothetical protein AB1540_02195 [Bdellovibrionota bacterium]
MSNAEIAIRAAKDVNADSLVPELYRSAADYYFKAKREYRLKNFEQSKKYAVRATRLAEQAEFEAYRNGGATPEVASKLVAPEGASLDSESSLNDGTTHTPSSDLSQLPDSSTSEPSLPPEEEKGTDYNLYLRQQEAEAAERERKAKEKEEKKTEPAGPTGPPEINSRDLPPGSRDLPQGSTANPPQSGALPPANLGSTPGDLNQPNLPVPTPQAPRNIYIDNSAPSRGQSFEPLENKPLRVLGQDENGEYKPLTVLGEDPYADPQKRDQDQMKETNRE